MSGPQDPAAAGRGLFRASHADRERVIELLKTAFVQDRLTKDELDMRAGQALSARTCAELAALTASIPAEPAAAGLARRSGPARRGPLARAAVKSGICLMITAVAIGGILLPVDPGGLSPWSGLMVFLAVSGLWTAVGIMACAVVTSWDQRSYPTERLRDTQPKVPALPAIPGVIRLMQSPCWSTWPPSSTCAWWP